MTDKVKKVDALKTKKSDSLNRNIFMCIYAHYLPNIYSKTHVKEEIEWTEKHEIIWRTKHLYIYSTICTFTQLIKQNIIIRVHIHAYILHNDTCIRSKRKFCWMSNQEDINVKYGKNSPIILTFHFNIRYKLERWLSLNIKLH